MVYLFEGKTEDFGCWSEYLYREIEIFLAKNRLLRRACVKYSVEIFPAFHPIERLGTDGLKTVDAHT